MQWPLPSICGHSLKRNNENWLVRRTKTYHSFNSYNCLNIYFSKLAWAKLQIEQKVYEVIVSCHKQGQRWRSIKSLGNIVSTVQLFETTMYRIQFQQTIALYWQVISGTLNWVQLSSRTIIICNWSTYVVKLWQCSHALFPSIERYSCVSLLT